MDRQYWEMGDSPRWFSALYRLNALEYLLQFGHAIYMGIPKTLCNVQMPDGCKIGFNCGMASANEDTNRHSWFSAAGKGISPLSLQNMMYRFFAEL